MPCGSNPSVSPCSSPALCSRCVPIIPTSRVRPSLSTLLFHCLRYPSSAAIRRISSARSAETPTVRLDCDSTALTTGRDTPARSAICRIVTAMGKSHKPSPAPGPPDAEPQNLEPIHDGSA